MASIQKPNTGNMGPKRDRFVRIVERRVNILLDGFDSLGKCANRRNYEYSDDDVKKIFGQLEIKIKEIKHLFKNSNQKKNRFKLSP